MRHPAGIRFASALALALPFAPAQAESVQTRLGVLAIDHGLPTAKARRTLYDELDFQRAVQAVI